MAREEQRAWYFGEREVALAGLLVLSPHAHVGDLAWGVAGRVVRLNDTRTMGMIDQE